MSKKVTVIPGDGIGPEVVSSAVAVINTLANEIEVVNADAGYECFQRTGESLPRMTMELVDESDAVLIGTFYDPMNDRLYRNPIYDIKRRSELFANVKYVQKITSKLGAIKSIDAIFVREDSADKYGVREIETLDGASVEMKVSYNNTKRICQFVRELAEKREAKRITCAHMSYNYSVSDGLFLNTFREVMADSTIPYDDMGADEMAAKIAERPRYFGYVISRNPYSDILSQEAAALAGGYHLFPTASIGKNKAIFSPMHGPLTELVGKNLVNPTATLFAAAEMLRYLGYTEEGLILADSVKEVYKNGIRTSELGGDTGTYDFTKEVINCIESKL